MGSVNKVILVGNLTRDPEMKHTEGKKPVCIVGLATTITGLTRKVKSTKSRNTTALWRLISWLRHATSISQREERSTLRGDSKPGVYQAGWHRKACNRNRP
jgi:single-stranded DNA-binding protein